MSQTNLSVLGPKFLLYMNRKRLIRGRKELEEERSWFTPQQAPTTDWTRFILVIRYCQLAPLTFLNETLDFKLIEKSTDKIFVYMKISKQKVK